MIRKRFPADIKLEGQTFLNDKKINANLYAFLQGISKCGEGITYIDKWDLPSQSKICEKIGLKSAKTYRAHLKYLMDTGYVQDDKINSRLILPSIEDIYMLLPLETLQLLLDTLQDQVVKIYIYLGQIWKNSDDKKFTYEGIGRHIGINVKGNECGYRVIRNALIVLGGCGLIKVSKSICTEEGAVRHQLLEWNVRYIDNSMIEHLNG